MDLALVAFAMAFVIWLYFRTNPLGHGAGFMFRRFVNWFPLGMSYAFLYMARYNLNVAKNALGASMSKEDFGIIFGVGTVVYGLSFLVNGPLVDKIGGKRGIIIATLGAAMANTLLGLTTYLLLTGRLIGNMTVLFSVLYGLNMYFQSYGAVSIIKVKAYWFHVRERGVFGAIFGTLISFGVYFAFDWGSAVADAGAVTPAHPLNFIQTLIRSVAFTGTPTRDAVWLVFYVPAVLLVFWAIADFFCVCDTPSDANYADFDTHDASSGEMEVDFTMLQLLKRIFTSPILLTVAAIEFTTGIVRNGVMQWFFIFGKEVPQPGAEFFSTHWGLILCITGIAGGFVVGWMSDSLFQSRRGPPAGIMNGIMFFVTIMLAVLLYSSPVGVGLCAVVLAFAGISVHAIMSGTAAADFGGRKASATASGITDGFVYLGTGFQSVCLGFLTTKSWLYWPLFLLPFTLIGLYLSTRMWNAIPAAHKKYLQAEASKKAAAQPVAGTVELI